MTPWDKAREMHEQINLDFDQALAYYQEFGHIISSPTSLIWGEQRHDSWLVYLAIGPDCLKYFIENQPYWLPNFTFCRMLKQRHSLKTYSMERVAKMFNIDTTLIKQKHGPRNQPNQTS